MAKSARLVAVAVTANGCCNVSRSLTGGVRGTPDLSVWIRKAKIMARSKNYYKPRALKQTSKTANCANVRRYEKVTDRYFCFLL